MDAQLRLMPEGRTTRRTRPTTGPTGTTGPARPAGGTAADTPEAPAIWRLSDSTRAVGRSGIAQAREALRQARQAAIAHPDDHHDHPAAA